MNKKVILMILDGWGKSPNPKVSAIDNANTPFIDSLYSKYPNAQLRTDGLNVGLPDGQMGNSEVGHMNLGAGRIVYQDLAKINLAVANKTMNQEKPLMDAFDYAKKNHKAVHFLGLVSDGGVHSHTSHLRGLIDVAQADGVQNMFVHAFTDGRDVDPKSGANYISDLENYLKNTNAKLACVIGRYYAMDRDKRWERVKLAYDLLVNGAGTKTQNAFQSIKESYANDVTDEFIQPLVITDAENNPLSLIKADDVVIFFNFRTDRGRELTEALSQKDFHEQNMHKLNLYYVTMTNYDDTYFNVHVVYDKDNITETLGEVLEKANKNQIRIAETEKYPHVTFFFSGGREEPFVGESRILKNSPKVATYDLQPEMSAFELKDALIPELQKGAVDFVCKAMLAVMIEGAGSVCSTMPLSFRAVFNAALSCSSGARSWPLACSISSPAATRRTSDITSSVDCPCGISAESINENAWFSKNSGSTNSQTMISSAAGTAVVSAVIRP